MAKINPNASKLIDEYISNLPDFSKEICTVIRKSILEANPNVVEDWKWRIPCFNGTKLVCGFAGFKKHVSLTFFNGSQISDKYNLFTDDCNAQNNRSIKFTAVSEINKNQLTEYLKEAFLLDEMGVKKVTSKKEVEIPELLQNALDKNTLAKDNFEKMAYTYRKEYAQHISDAKRESTKLKRLEKVISNLELNIKMHEQYKC